MLILRGFFVLFNGALESKRVKDLFYCTRGVDYNYAFTIPQKKLLTYTLYYGVSHDGNVIYSYRLILYTGNLKINHASINNDRTTME